MFSWLEDHFEVLLCAMTFAAVVGIWWRTDPSVGPDTWPAYVGLPVALLVWWIWNRISPTGRGKS